MSTTKMKGGAVEPNAKNRTEVKELFRELGYTSKTGVYDKSNKFTKAAKTWLYGTYQKDEGKGLSEETKYVRKNINKMIPSTHIYNPQTSNIVLRERVFSKKKDNLMKKFKDKGLVKTETGIKFSDTNRTISGVAYYDLIFHYPDGTKGKRSKERTFNFPYVENWLQVVKDQISDTHQADSGDAEIKFKEIKLLRTNYDNKIIQKMKNIKMKKVQFSLDGDSYEHNWDKGDGSCVPSFLRHYYKDDKVIKQFLTDEVFDMRFDEGWREEGVSSRELVSNWADSIGLKAIGLNKNRECFIISNPDTPLNVKTLIFICHNDHIYPITDLSKIRSYANKYLKKDLGLYKPVKKEEEVKPKNYEIEFVNKKVERPLDFLFDKMIESKTEVLDENIHISSNNELISFILKDKKYIFDDEKFMGIKKWYEYKDIPYDGTKISTICNQIFDKLKLEESFPNQILNDCLNLPNVKNRIHIGGSLRDEIYDTENNFRMDWIESKNIKSFDITKCHSSILQKPLEEWIIFDLYSHIEHYSGGPIELGMYIVMTEDKKIFFGNNWYTSALVEFGLKKGVIDKSNITHVVKSARTLPKDYFKGLLNEYDSYAGGKEHPAEKEFLKGLYNTTSGILGRTTIKQIKKHIAQNIDEPFNYLQENAHKNTFSHNHAHKHGEDTYNFHIYGNKNQIQKSKHNLPMYCQILDQQIIKLYEFQERLGGELLYRKVDTLIMKNPRPDYKDILGENWGDLREQTLTEDFIIRPKEYFDVEFNLENSLLDRDWMKKENITDSKNYLKGMCELFSKGQGCLIHGEAGAGKSYVLDKFREYVGEDTSITVSFTNFAALNVRGKTFHRQFKLNTKKQISEKVLKSLSWVRAIFVDESGVVPSYLWDILHKIKMEHQIPIYCFVHWRQLTPVGEEDRCFKNHPVLKSITDNNYAVLNYINGVGRYDDALHDFTEKYQYIQDFLKQGKMELGRNTDLSMNICFTNNMRKFVNDRVMKKEMILAKERGERVSDIINIDKYHEKLKMTPTSGSQINDMIADKIKGEAPDWIQDMCFFKGMPLVGMKNALPFPKKEGEEREMSIYNSERFIIEELLDIGNQEKKLRGIDKFTLSFKIKSLSRGHTIEITMIELLNNLAMAYCITCHKSMGSSINEPFTIWETENQNISENWLYTAITRATKLEYINVA